MRDTRMRQLPAKYSGTCATCGKTIKRGDNIIYAPASSTSKVRCLACGRDDLVRAEAEMADDTYLSGTTNW